MFKFALPVLFPKKKKKIALPVSMDTESNGF